MSPEEYAKYNSALSASIDPGQLEEPPPAAHMAIQDLGATIGETQGIIPRLDCIVSRVVGIGDKTMSTPTSRDAPVRAGLAGGILNERDRLVDVNNRLSNLISLLGEHV